MQNESKVFLYAERSPASSGFSKANEIILGSAVRGSERVLHGCSQPTILGEVVFTA